MFTKILIANRGEIACRIMRTARLLGINTVAVYSDADANAEHVAMADEAIHIGASPARESYLIGDKIIAAALRTGAQAIHPGYGFLSENAAFCRACEANNIVFIGPRVEAIEAMGSKSAAKRIMETAGVPLVPGYHGADQADSTLHQAARDIGYPVLLKATAGGGGKGMRVVNSDAEFDEALGAARREAMNGFGDDTMLVEKYLTQPRHVEIQVFCDEFGNGVYVFERDCSVQRRHQKVIEEAPAPGVSAEIRAAMGDAALRAAQAINYRGAGTVEFLLDRDGSFYFMEMNTRLQVEHPVTEMISGQDLVEWQLRVAAGQPLPATQADLQINGHAFEARIYAEDPDNEFLPQTGKLQYLQPPQTGPHVRVDSGVRQGDEVSVYYDPMIAKLIVWDENRDRALQRLRRALMDFRIEGVTTNIDFLYRLADCPAFIAADLDTGFIEKHRDNIFRDTPSDLQQALPLAALYLYLQQLQSAATNPSAAVSPWANASGWRLNQSTRQHYAIAIHDTVTDVEVIASNEPSGRIVVQWQHEGQSQRVEAQGTLTRQTRADDRGTSHNDHSLRATVDGYQSDYRIVAHGSGYSLYSSLDKQASISFHQAQPEFETDHSGSSAGSLNAPMNGTIVALLVEPGQVVSAGTTILVMEAMKMEHAIKAPAEGAVREFYFSGGDLVAGGAELLAFDAADK